MDGETMKTKDTVYDAIVIGAGQAGLATGYHLQQAGLRFLILEAGNEPGGSWPCFYDSLLLNSPARYSSLPGLPFPGDPERYPRRDEAVAYLRRYAAHFKLPVMTGVRVTRVERFGQRFRLTTNRGRYESQTIVAATGFFGRPNLPDMSGQAEFRGQILHAADYRRPEPFQGQRVVVVGGGNAAVQIGVELTKVAKVTLVTRHSVRFLPQRLLGQDIHFWLRLSGLDHTQWLGDLSNPVYDKGSYRAAIAAGKPDHRPMFQRFSADGVVWGDGRHESVDTVIFATGYRPHLPYLAELGALDQAGRVLQQNGMSMTVPGLYYVGLPRQRSVASATLRGVGPDAKIVVNHLRHYSDVPQGNNGRLSTGMPVRLWGSRSSELAGLIGLIAFAVKQQVATQRFAAPKLVGEALVRSLRVSAGFVGFGHAAMLYSHT
jgi:putative flavoprotein involved in K+ transport